MKDKLDNYKADLYIDMDGTIAEFGEIKEFEELLEKGYFLNRPPMTSVIEGLFLFNEEYGDKVTLHILSSYLTESSYARDEKKEWLKRYIPWIKEDNIHFVPCGTSKSLAHNGIMLIQNIEIGTPQFLLDDYSKNLHDWISERTKLREDVKIGIKLLNGINGNNGSWQKTNPRISSDALPYEIFGELEYYIIQNPLFEV